LSERRGVIFVEKGRVDSFENGERRDELGVENKRIDIYLS
jgi:hypothetical protein